MDIIEPKARVIFGDLGVESLQTLLPSLPLLFDCSDDVVFVADDEGRLVYLNHKLLELMGSTYEQVCGKALSVAFAEDIAIGHYSDEVKKVVANKKSNTHTRIKGVAGAVCETVTTSPIVDSRQSVLGTMTIVKEAIIEKPLAEAEVKKRAAYQQAMVDSIPFMVWLKDKEGRLLVANIAYAEGAGVDNAEKLEGKTDFDLWPKDLAAGYVEDDLKVLNSGEATILVEQVKKANGLTYWAETYKAAVTVDGEVIGTLGYARDVTERKALLSTITQKELEYDYLVKNLPLAIVRYDKNARRMFINLPNNDEKTIEAQGLLGTTPLELWDASVKNITAEEYQDKLMHVLLHGEAQTFEMYCDVDGVASVSMVNMLPQFDEKNHVVGALALANDVTEISKYRDDLEYLAFHDALTSLPNRTLLNQRLRQATADGSRFGLMFMDLDFFKAINDTLGHVVGDELLVDAAKRIAAAVSSDDIVARIGGDEFAILVTNLHADADLGHLATKIAEQLSVPFNIEGVDFFITASIGIACYPTHSEKVEDLMKYADMAMYEAKKQGRNSYQYYTPELTQYAMEHLATVTALRYAIEEDELYLLCQPKVDIRTGGILGAEMLLRWHAKDLGQMQPDQFIPIAEESGLIINIGAWVLRASCEMATQLNQNREVPLKIAVNVSSKEFVGNNYIEKLQHCLQETGCKPSWLTLEITESLLLQDTGEAMETLNKIDGMGIHLSIDDFGTGYSALAYLSKFPIRQVKIDRSFVMDICDNQSDASLVRAIIAMALSLDKELVAEGIETQEQADLIEQYGCHQAQGYLYSKPVSFSDFIHLLQRQIH